MDSVSKSDQGVADLPSEELWGREVRDANGRLVGTIDSIVRSYQGPVRAVVRRAGKRSKWVVVRLDGGILDGGAIVIAWAVPEGLPGGAVGSRPHRFLWP